MSNNFFKCVSCRGMLYLFVLESPNEKQIYMENKISPGMVKCNLTLLSENCNASSFAMVLLANIARHVTLLVPPSIQLSTFLF